MKVSKQARREAKQLFRLCQVDGQFDEARAQQLLQKLLAARPRGCLELLTHFQRLVKLDGAAHSAKVESAAPLPPALSSAVQAKLAGVYGPGLKASFTQNPALIGGLRITVGSDVYDGSVKGRLTRLEEQFA